MAHGDEKDEEDQPNGLGILVDSDSIGIIHEGLFENGAKSYPWLTTYYNGSTIAYFKSPGQKGEYQISFTNGVFNWAKREEAGGLERKDYFSKEELLKEFDY